MYHAYCRRQLNNSGSMSYSFYSYYCYTELIAKNDRRRVLRDTGDILDFGGVQWELLIINVVVWIIIYFCIWKGITHAQKVNLRY